MTANRLICRTSLLVAGLIACSTTAVAQGTNLSPYERGLMCDLTKSCESAAADASADPADDSQSVTLDNQEASFEIFSNKGTRNAPARAAAPAPARMTASRPASTPRFNLGAPTRTSRVAIAASSRTSSGAGVRSRIIDDRRPRGAEMRIQFANGSADLASGDLPELNAWANGLQSPDFARLRIRIEGHTNAVGNPDFNLSLSERRARAVADYLAAHGISPDRIEARGYGSQKPRIERAPGDPRNRRVEITKID